MHHAAGVGRDGSESLRYRTTGPKTGQAVTDLERIIRVAEDSIQALR